MAINAKLQKEFAAQFDEQVIELQVLMKSSCNGAAVLRDALKPSAGFYASYNMESGEYSENTGRLEWLVEKEKPEKSMLERLGIKKQGQSKWGYDFEKLGIYRVKVRKCIPQELDPNQLEEMNNRYMLLSSVREKKPCKELKRLAEEYAKPVSVKSSMGELVLNREMSMFEGTFTWQGGRLMVFLETDENEGNTADNALAAFETFSRDMENWDLRMKHFAAGELMELANDWLADLDSEDKPEEITDEYFVRVIEMRELSFESNGCITAYYSDGDLFWGHSIEIFVDENGELESADIVG